MAFNRHSYHHSIIRTTNKTTPRMPSSSYAPLADEVNPPFSKSTPAPIVTRSGTITYQQEDERDLGEMPRFSRYDKGKGKERAWDVEQGQEHIQETRSYPPISSEEEDERRIQANLSRLAARDQAERKIRSSRLFPRPNSLRPDSTHNGWTNGEVPYGSPKQLTIKPPDRSGANSPTSPSSAAIGLMNGHARQSTSSPRPDDIQGRPNKYANPFIHRSSASIHTDANSPDPGFDYAGPGWNGGAAAAEEGNADNNNSEHSRLRKVLPDKWWKALCAWGSDLDGGHDNQDDGGQAGRTNPFE